MDYRTLRSDVELWTGNTSTEFLASIDRFIKQAEARIGMLVTLPAYNKVTSLTAAAGVSNLSLSSLTAFVAVNYIFVAGYGILEQKDSSFINEAYPDGSEAGPPRYFAMQDATTLLFGPTPDQNYAMTLEYTGLWPSLVDLGAATGTQTAQTFLSQKFETALLNGTLMYANMYMKDLEAVSMFRAEMMDNLGLIDKFARGKMKKPKSEDNQAANEAGDTN